MVLSALTLGAPIFGREIKREKFSITLKFLNFMIMFELMIDNK